MKKINIPTLSKIDLRKVIYEYYEGPHNTIYANKIIDLAAKHTLSLELLSKTAKSGRYKLDEFYNELIKYDFNIPTKDKILANHGNLADESIYILQLEKLFNFHHLSSRQKEILYLFSLIPSINTYDEIARKWMDAEFYSLIDYLSEYGWIYEKKCTDKLHKEFSMYPVIAATIRNKFSLFDMVLKILEFIKNVNADIYRNNNESYADKMWVLSYSLEIMKHFHTETKGFEDLLNDTVMLLRGYSRYTEAVVLQKNSQSK